MTADIVNLRQRRKHKAQLAKEAEAAENRRRFGRPSAERRHDEATNDLDRKHLDEHKREEPAGGSDSEGCD